MPEMPEPRRVYGQDRLSAPGATSSSNAWKVAGASVCGTSHAKSGIGCQDSHWTLTLPGDVLLAAVADGAGSAARSELGAAIAARTAVEELERRRRRGTGWPDTKEAWAAVMRGALDAAREAVEQAADVEGLAPRELASTLIVLLAMPDLIVAAQVGDGAAVMADAAGVVTALTTPQIGEFLNETTFLVSPRAVEQAQVVVRAGQFLTV